jgi:vesicle-associated membrane protein 7
MSFVYGMVAFDTTSIAEYDAGSGGNYKSVARELLNKLKFDDNRIAYDQGDFIFSIMSEQTKLSVIILSDKGIAANVRFHVVEQVRNKFISKYMASYSTAREGSKSQEFAPEFQRIFKECQNPTNAKIAQINANLDATQSIMTKNLSDALARSEQLEVMQEKSESIKQSAHAFEREATDIRKSMCIQRYKWYVIGGTVALVVLVVIIVIIATVA